MKFSKSHPHIHKLFHPTKNNNLDFDSLTRGMRKKVWWLCPKGHNYQREVYLISKLTNTTGCPYCSGKLVDPELSLAAHSPKIASEWDHEKNTKDPSQYMPCSAKKVWWICPNGHSYFASISNRNSLGRGCNVCSGHVVDTSNSLLTKYPEIAAELHPDKNPNIDPSKIGCSDKSPVWWRCSVCEHEWKAMIHNRAREKRSTGCPACANRQVTGDNNLQALYPDLANQWHPERNGNLRSKDIVPGSNKKVWWLCANGHSWKVAPSSRIKRHGISGCPKCSRQTSTMDLRIYTELLGIYPKTKLRCKLSKIEVDVFITELDVAIEFDGAYWHQSKKKSDENKTRKLSELGYEVIRLRQRPLEKLKSSDIIISGNEILKKHIDAILNTIGSSRLNDAAKDYLHNSLFCNESLFKEWISYLPDPHPTESITGTYPEIAKYWDFDKNYPVTPSNIRPGSEINFWWLCPVCQNSWEQDPYHICMRKKHPCNICSREVASGVYNFALKSPEAAREWHNTKNGNSRPENFTHGSDRKFWFLCNKGHEYEASLANRTAGKGCPYCAGRKASPENSLQSKAPDVAKMWDFDRNGDLTPNNVTKGSDKFVFWRCNNGHSWEARVYKMVKIKTIHCPQCRIKKG